MDRDVAPRGAEPLDIAHRHRRRNHEMTAGGTLAVIARATPGSDSVSSASSAASTAARATRSAPRQLVEPVAIACSTPSCASCAHSTADRHVHLPRADQVRIGDQPDRRHRDVRRARTRRATAPAPSTPVASRGAATTSGRCAAAKPAWRSIASNRTTAASSIWQPDSGSASTGHPVASASACTAAGRRHRCPPRSLHAACRRARPGRR